MSERMSNLLEALRSSTDRRFYICMDRSVVELTHVIGINIGIIVCYGSHLPFGLNRRSIKRHGKISTLDMFVVPVVVVVVAGGGGGGGGCCLF